MTVKLVVDNSYTKMQKSFYAVGTTNHLDHNYNPDYWNVLLGDLKNKKKWKNKKALDFGSGRGRNVSNVFTLCEWERVDGIDISPGNINYCIRKYKDQKSSWYINNGIDVAELLDNEYDYIVSTIALQHIPVYDIRRGLLVDLLRVLKPGGLFSFQMGFGHGLGDPSGLNRPRSSYHDNAYEATGTNSDHDVRVQSVGEIREDLLEIGYTSVKTKIKESFSDAGHPEWIYVKCRKPKV